MSNKILAATMGLAASGAARAASDWPSDGTTWFLLLIGMVAIGLFAATRMRRD